LQAISCRSETRGFTAELHRPPSAKLYGGLAISALLQGAAQFVPPLRRLLALSPLGPTELLAIGGVAVGSTVMNDLIGYLLRGDSSPSSPPLM
jgi:Ca2+-transporting ATPase